MANRLIRMLCVLPQWLFLALFLCSMVGAANTPKPGVLRLVTESWPPYAYECDGKACGMDVEMVSQVLSRLGYQVQVQFVPWPRALSQLQVGKADAILDISKGERNERERFLLFPKEALSTSSSALFYRKSEPFTFTGLSSLAGKRVAVVRGYNYSANFMSATHFSRESGVSHEQNMKKLARGRVDLALMDSAVGLHLIRSLNLEAQIAVDATRFVSGQLYLAFAIRPELTELVADFERELIAYKQTVEYEQLLARYGLISGQDGAR